MEKYKCIKEYPGGYALGEVVNEGYFSRIPNSAYFAKYYFTTNDGVDIFYNDTYYLITSDGIQKDRCLGYKDYSKLELFSIRQKAMKYLKNTLSCDTCIHDDEIRTMETCGECELLTNRVNNWEEKTQDFETDKWYKLKLADVYGYYKEEKSSGFNRGNWLTTMHMSDISLWELANISKVISLLESKAITDYPVGTNYKNVYEPKYEYKISYEKYIYKCTSREVIANNSSIFYHGKWAEIIKSKQLTLGKYDVTITDGAVKTKIGSVTIEDWKHWYKFMYNMFDLNTFDPVDFIELRLGRFSTKFSEDSFNNIIGCIKNVTWSQITDISKSLKK